MIAPRFEPLEFTRASSGEKLGCDTQAKRYVNSSGSTHRPLVTYIRIYVHTWPPVFPHSPRPVARQKIATSEKTKKQRNQQTNKGTDNEPTNQPNKRTNKNTNNQAQSQKTEGMNKRTLL